MHTKYDDGKDCLCSALSINCLQFGCFLHQCPRCYCDSKNNDWITKLTEDSPQKKLRDLVIPGTHDSASVTISKLAPFSAVGLCQNISVLEQLRRGARYLDIRVGGKKNSTLVDDTIIVHGILKGAPFPNILEEIDQFRTDNPREFLIIEIITDKNKHGMSNQQLHDVLQLITSTFNDMMITQEDLDWFKLNSVTLGQLSEKKKNALILINDGWTNFTHDGKYYDFSAIANDFGCHDHAHYMKNKWHNTKCAQTLLQSNETFLANGCNECDKFMNNQFVMTPQPPRGVGDAIAMLLGVTSLRPVSLARELYRKDYLETFIRDNADKSWNVVLLDFIDLCPLLIRFLIGLNSSKQLKVKEAYVKSKDGSIKLDRTDIVNKLKRRSSSLYLLDFKKDLDLSVDEGALHLKAQFQGEEYVDHIIPFNKDTEYLLCDM